MNDILPANRSDSESATPQTDHVANPPPASLQALIPHVRELIKQLGEDPDREGLLKTPERVAKAYQMFTSGYRTDIKSMIEGAIFNETCDEMVVVRNIELYSLCEHHLLPFVGQCHIAYIPNGKIVGLSKLARLVDAYSRRLQVQERLTVQIAECLQETLDPRGVGVVIDARHLCMMMRGVQKQNSSTVTSSLLGVFKEDVRSRAEFMNLIHTSIGMRC